MGLAKRRLMTGGGGENDTWIETERGVLSEGDAILSRRPRLQPRQISIFFHRLTDGAPVLTDGALTLTYGALARIGVEDKGRIAC